MRISPPSAAAAEGGERTSGWGKKRTTTKTRGEKSGDDNLEVVYGARRKYK